jgi:hypothetical protein
MQPVSPIAVQCIASWTRYPKKAAKLTKLIADACKGITTIIFIEDRTCWHAMRYMIYRVSHSSPVTLNNMNIVVGELGEGCVVQCDGIRLIDRDGHIRSDLRGVR